MKILVSGGAGFLGSHLIEKLLANKDSHVICIDNYKTGSYSNIKNFVNNKNFSYIDHDVKEPIDLKEIDQIYNLACPASPVQYQLDPIDTIKTCIYGSFNLLELSIKNNAKILQASTSEIYGDPLVHPQGEDYFGNVNTTGKRSCYDEGKRCAETIFFDYYRQLNAKIKVVRIFNTYGPRMAQNDGRVVSNFILQALNNIDLTIYGDGSQTRSLCYVDDLISGIVKFMSTVDTVIGPMNLGNDYEITVKDLALKIISITNSKSEIKYVSLPEDDPKKRQPDINVAKNILRDWYPKVAIEEGLEKTIEYFKLQK